jgi:hypothetical protein
VIGVIAKADQRVVVREFFELFKTPWEFHEEERTYDVVIATADRVPPLDAPLLLIYGCDTTSTDPAIGVIAGRRRAGASLQCGSMSAPIYGGLLTFQEDSAGAVHATTDEGIAALRFDRGGATIIRLGYDLFEEVRFLLTVGQPVQHARVPTLDAHIRMLRTWILNAGVPLVEIPPVPAGYDFTVCLTHDIDFVGIRRHRFDHTMWGFLYRSTVGSLRRVLKGRLSVARLLMMWRAAASLPFVFLGWTEDFWNPFPWYLHVEQGLPATYFLIPFKRRVGQHVPGRHPARRATAYDVADIPQWPTALREKGCEVGVHGIDAWHDVPKGRAELMRITAITGVPIAGVRMHWLLSDVGTASTLERAGYTYDASAGYNETIGYLNGTTQTFRPFTTHTLLELPLHIQDGALFYPHNLDLSEAEAAEQCRLLLDHAQSSGGVLTVLWHDRSHGPERLWGDFYIGLVQTLRSSNVWFATASQAVGWFHARRRVRFARPDHGSHSSVRVFYEGPPIDPPLILRQHDGARATDTTWNGVTPLDVRSPLPVAS